MRSLIVTTAIVFIINFALQVGLDFALSPNNGNIIVSDALKIDSVNCSQTILLTNYQKKTIYGIEFYSNKGVIDSVYRNDKIKIVKIDNNKFRIAKLYPQMNITLMVTMKNKIDSDQPNIIPLNHEEFQFLYNKSSELGEDKVNWVTISINCGVAACFFALLWHFLDKKLQERLKMSKERFNGIELEFKEKNRLLKEEITELKDRIKITGKSIKESQKKADKHSANIDSLRIAWAKIRLLLIRQVRDLKKENEFYKSLLSDVVEKSNGKIEINRLEELVKNALQTHSTRINVEKDGALVDTIANILTQNKIEE